MADASTQPGHARPPLHAVLPPLALGTATFNTQYVSDPQSLPYRDIVARAISLGVNAFDTSPYYGPSEHLLGTALDALTNPAPSESDDPNPKTTPLARSSFVLVTKAGRIGPSEFDYSPAWIRYSVLRSLRRLRTPYLDLVYAHDVEHVSPAEALAAVRELRRLRDDDGLVRYVGISAYPVDVLCDRAEMIRAETGEPLDAVLSYGHFTVQNRRLGLGWLDDDEGVVGVETGGSSSSSSSLPLARLKKAGVDVVLNASMLGMGLLTSRGIPVDPQTPASGGGGGGAGETPSLLARWHPSPPELRLACKELAEMAAGAGERLESVAIRWSLGEWARVGAAAGVGVDFSVPGASSAETRKLGVSVCGVTSVAELEETVAEWRGAVSSLGQAEDSANAEFGPARQEKVTSLVRNDLWPALGSWIDYAWESPPPGFVNNRREGDLGTVPDDGIVDAYEQAKQGGVSGQSVPNTR